MKDLDFDQIYAIMKASFPANEFRTYRGQKPLILEVELPDTSLSQRRIKFYERLGFYINPYDYVQPALSGQAAIPLKMMSYPEPLTPKQFANVKSVLYSKVYKVAGW
ncbi:hypothetical protein [Paenibacillus lutimineralis]|uniref:Uncharacterized protein n=1 Tax=Paenibacillus lutimineralis TaxID=2707005 RepID=A0A3S9UZ57_9BACL|nr:hypothetical protein [Paenibacillus lutimineralis]AZS15605.1 hypothetical protein EI981_14895 [Paenibacillus lutimineralis]